jgi:Asp-tRNA(Asn)/Glu-tRNA(Gln) amidotransferase A subunit family amidase
VVVSGFRRPAVPSPGSTDTWPRTSGGGQALGLVADHVGPLARCATDLGVIQSVLDPALFRPDRQTRRKLVVGHGPAFYEDAEKIVCDGVSQPIAACRDLGAELREVQLPKPDEVSEIHEVIFAAEATAYHRRFFDEIRDQYPTLARKMFDLAEQHRSFEYVLAMRKRTELTIGCYRFTERSTSS